jgi:hypothetical protein
VVERGHLRLTSRDGVHREVGPGGVVGHEDIVERTDRDSRLEATRRARVAVLDEGTYRRTLASAPC